MVGSATAAAANPFKQPGKGQGKGGKSGCKKCVPCTLAVKQKLKEENRLAQDYAMTADTPLSVSA